MHPVGQPPVQPYASGTVPATAAPRSPDLPAASDPVHPHLPRLGSADAEVNENGKSLSL
jgi:hypothetical protein